MKYKYENGYALPSVLLISLLVLTILLSLLSIIYFTNKGTNKLLEKKRLELACYSAVQMAISDTTLMFTDTSVVLIDSLNVFLQISQKGFWREITAVSNGINDSIKFIFTLGFKSNENGYFENAIVFSHPNLRATIAGNTEIKGDILSTSKQINVENIFGEPPTRNDYHNGKIKINQQIKSHLIEDSLFKQIEKSFFNISQDIIEVKELDQFNILEFEEGVKYFFNQGLTITGFNDDKVNSNIKKKNDNTIIINVEGKVKFNDGIIFKKHLEIYSDSLIVIGKNCYLENVILFSKGPIFIDDGSMFKNVQLFSRDSIFIRDSQFNYPSIICLNIDDTDSANQDNAIVIENSIINGSVLLMTKTSGLSSNRTKIKIDEKSKVHGIVYSENNLELIGEVFGTVFTYNFWYYKEPTEYINWLINVKVNREKLEQWFLIPPIFSNQGKYQILKEEWIY